MKQFNQGALMLKPLTLITLISTTNSIYCLEAVSKPAVAKAQVGFVSSNCSGGSHLWIPGKTKSEHPRDIYQTIAKHLDIPASDSLIDQKIMQERLTELFGARRVTSLVVIRPSGQIQDVKVIDEKDEILVKKVTEFFESIGTFEVAKKDGLTHTYRIALPFFSVYNVDNLVH